MIAWFDEMSQADEDQVNLFDLTYRQWAARDYTGVTPSQSLYLYYLSQSIGFPWLINTASLNVQRDLVSYLKSPRYPDFASNVNQLINLLFQVGWISSFGLVTVSTGNPIQFAELLILYSDSLTPPSAPPSQMYSPFGWATPTGWTRAPASSTYVLRGYLYGDQILWLTPVPTATPPTYYDVADLAHLPVSANNGDVCGVFDDGSGDQGAIYTWDNGQWYKCSTPNASQGTVDIQSYLNAGGVWAPDGTVTSEDQPPLFGPTQGYGLYGIWGISPTIAFISLAMVLTDAGNANLGVLIQLFRKIKPYQLAVVLYLTYAATLEKINVIDTKAIY